MCRMILLERQEALRALWDAAFPEEELHDLVSEQWKKMGWQEKDPSTDLSGRELVVFCYEFSDLSALDVKDLLLQASGERVADVVTRPLAMRQSFKVMIFIFKITFLDLHKFFLAVCRCLDFNVIFRSSFGLKTALPCSFSR